MHATPTGAIEALTGLLLHLLFWERRGRQRIVSEVWDVGPTFNPVEDIVAY
jgi:hypothetical protein